MTFAPNGPVERSGQDSPDGGGRTTLLIGGHRKSGTSALRSAFDGRRDIWVPPHDLNILYTYYPDWTRESRTREEQEHRYATVTLDAWEPYYESPEHRATFQDLKNWVESSVRDADLGTFDGVVDFTLAALWEVAPPEARLLVVKETSAEMYAPMLLDSRRNLRFLHLVRDPRDNYAALAAGQKVYYDALGDDHLDTLTSMIIRYKFGVAFLKANQERFGSRRYRLMKFEELVANPRDVTQGLAEWLNLDWNETFTQPTRGGSAFEGNSYGGRRFSGFSTENLNRWNERISTDEASLLEFVLREEMEFLGYESATDRDNAARLAGEWYGRMNHRYFFSDPFARTW